MQAGGHWHCDQLVCPGSPLRLPIVEISHVQRCECRLIGAVRHFTASCFSADHFYGLSGWQGRLVKGDTMEHSPTHKQIVNFGAPDGSESMRS